MSKNELLKSREPRIGFASLGCPKALVDSERILTRLRTEGYGIAPSYEAADLMELQAAISTERLQEDWPEADRAGRRH